MNRTSMHGNTIITQHMRLTIANDLSRHRIQRPPIIFHHHNSAACIPGKAVGSLIPCRIKIRGRTLLDIRQRIRIQRSPNCQVSGIVYFTGQRIAHTRSNDQTRIPIVDEAIIYAIHTYFQCAALQQHASGTKGIRMLHLDFTTVYICAAGIRIGQAERQFTPAFLLQCALTAQAAGTG